MPRKVESSGPPHARIMIIGEAPGEEEEKLGVPFVGASGNELNRMLREVGIKREDCYVTNVCKYRPAGNKIERWITDKKKTGIANDWAFTHGRYYSPEIAESLDELGDEIVRVAPKLIITLGNVPLWALTGEWGITKWRGSQLEINGAALIPTYHPSAILRQWSYRHQAISDLQRAAKSLDGPLPRPPFRFTDKPTFAEAFDFINQLYADQDVALDVETGNGHIVCIGIATSPTRALCIPLMTAEGPYWQPHDRLMLLNLLETRLTETTNIGQNFSYDNTYFDADFGWHPRLDFDTYNAQSVLWPGEPRALGFLSSIYCDHHKYWKDDAKEWFKLKSAADYDRLFLYNCEDAARTWEIAQKQRAALKAHKLWEQFADRMIYDRHVFDMAQRGVYRDPIRTKQLDHDISEAIQAKELRLNDLAGHPLNCRSPKQVADFFYRELGCKEIKVRVPKSDETRTSTGDEALEQLIERYPQHEEAARLVLDVRSLGSLRSTFVRAEREPDGRLRSSFAACGTETFRLTSSKNNFGRGCNLLNVTADSAGVNLRNCIVPDPGYTYFDCDLERADLQVVVWEADDEGLKKALRDGVDIHLVNAIELYGIAGIPYDECYESHPNYHDHIERVGSARGLGKRFVHLTNYGGKARKCAAAVGITVHEAEMGQQRWFSLHPGIRSWQRATEARLNAVRCVTNRFGYRRTYFDRLDALLPEALAWGPQSTIAIVASKIHMAFDEIEGVEVQLQCYDSIAGQFRTADAVRILPAMYAASRIIIPYRDPLIIPLGLKTSESSWGECRSQPWPTHGSTTS